MCGIAGIIYKNGNGAHRIGRDMTSMLQAMKHRGPDSTGFALYRPPSDELILRVKLADAARPGDMDRPDEMRRRRRETEPSSFSSWGPSSWPPAPLPVRSQLAPCR